MSPFPAAPPRLPLPQQTVVGGFAATVATAAAGYLALSKKNESLPSFDELKAGGPPPNLSCPLLPSPDGSALHAPEASFPRRPLVPLLPEPRAQGVAGPFTKQHPPAHHTVAHFSAPEHLTQRSPRPSTGGAAAGAEQ